MDTGTAGTAMIVVVLTILFRDGVPALVKAFPAAERLLSGRAKARREDSAEERKVRREEAEDEQLQVATTVAELKKVIAMLKADGREDREQIHDLRDEVAVVANRATACEIREARKDERITALEDALTAAGIPHRKRTPDGSKAHPPLEQKPKEPTGE